MHFVIISFNEEFSAGWINMVCGLEIPVLCAAPTGEVLMVPPDNSDTITTRYVVMLLTQDNL